MKKYDVECRICGKLNRDLYLVETDGWMECECCQATVRIDSNGRWKMSLPIGVYKQKQEAAAT